MMLFSSLVGGGGEGGRRDTTGFPLVLNWDREIIFFRKIELTIFNYQRINIRVFWELLLFSWKICFIFTCSPWYFSPEKVDKQVQKTSQISWVIASLEFSGYSLSNRLGVGSAPILKQLQNAKKLKRLFRVQEMGTRSWNALHSCVPWVCLCVPAFLKFAFAFPHSCIQFFSCILRLGLPRSKFCFAFLFSAQQKNILLS